MHTAQAFATYSFGLTFETSYISEQFRINSKRYFTNKIPRAPPLRLFALSTAKIAFIFETAKKTLEKNHGVESSMIVRVTSWPRRRAALIRL